MTEKLVSLWDDEDLEIPQEKKRIKKIKEKIDNPKEQKTVKKSKKVTMSLDEQIESVTNEVLNVLGKQKDNFIVIKDYNTYINYINECIKAGEVAIDTETNNTVDYINCKLMGLCLYYPGGKQAYVPVNHVNKDTKERLSWQLTESQIAEGLKILYANRPHFEPRYEDDYYGDWYREVLLPKARKEFPYTIFQNAKFDYQVLKCTCGVECPCDWDTLYGTKLLDENTFNAGLKAQYIEKIDPTQQKYDIEGLFEGLEYAIFDPEIFAYYAATDAMMTWKLYKYQMNQFLLPENEKLYKLAIEVEMPCTQVTAEMELRGVYYDQEYSARLKDKYHNKLNILNDNLTKVIEAIKPQIQAWKETDDAKNIQWKKQSEKQRANAVKSTNYDETLWKNIQGIWYKKSKSKLEQLDEEITVSSLDSPTQLGIILYDILKCPIVNKEKPRGTGDDELEAIKGKHISNEMDNFIALIQQARELNKLINSFIDSLPNKINQKDGRIHGSFNQYGTATGRYSSSEPNLQQIPSHNKELRMLFKAEPQYKDKDLIDNKVILSYLDEVNTFDRGWVNVKYLNVGDKIETADNEFYSILSINNINDNFELILAI